MAGGLECRTDAPDLPSGGGENAAQSIARFGIGIDDEDLHLRTHRALDSNSAPKSRVLTPKPDSELRPERVDAAADVVAHDDLVRPAPQESFLFPFAGCVDPHLAAVARQACGEVELVDRPVHELDVALRIDRG